MITELDWQDAIAKCQAVNKPNENAYLLLAAATYMTEHDKTQVHTLQNYSNSTQDEYDSGSEFCQVSKGKDISAVMAVIDELMEALELLSPKLYEATINKIRAV